MINRIKYHIRNLLFFTFSIPTTIIAAIRFKISYHKHRDDKDTGIGLVVDNLDSGGLENIVMNLYKGYREHKHPSYIIIVNNKVSNYIETLEDDPRQFRILYSNKANLLNYCRIHKIYTLHYHFSTFAMRMAHFLGIKTVYTIHNTYVWFTPKMWRHLKKSLKKCNYLIAVSDFAKEYFIKKTGFKNITTINNGIDISLIQQNLDNSSKTQSRSLYGIPAKDKVIAMISSFSEQKHHLLLIGAMEESFKKNICDPTNTKIIMCGPVLDKKLYRKIQKTIKNSPYQSSFIINDPIKPNEIGAFLNEIPDLIVLPSLYEGGVPPLIVVEALICNKPVIMTDLGIKNGLFKKYIQTIPRTKEDLTDLDLDSIRKIVYSKKSPNTEQLIQKIQAVLQSPQNYVPNIPKSILKTLDTHNMTKKYLEVIFGH